MITERWLNYSHRCCIFPPSLQSAQTSEAIVCLLPSHVSQISVFHIDPRWFFRSSWDFPTPALPTPTFLQNLVSEVFTPGFITNVFSAQTFQYIPDLTPTMWLVVLRSQVSVKEILLQKWVLPNSSCQQNVAKLFGKPKVLQPFASSHTFLVQSSWMWNVMSIHAHKSSSTYTHLCLSLTRDLLLLLLLHCLCSYLKSWGWINAAGRLCVVYLCHSLREHFFRERRRRWRTLFIDNFQLPNNWCFDSLLLLSELKPFNMFPQLSIKTGGQEHVNFITLHVISPLKCK